MRPWVVGDAEVILRDWGGPILILHGEQDMGFPLPLAERLHAALLTSELAVITGAAHLCHYEQPDQWADRIRTYLVQP